jgi:hypothetical protein
MSETPTATNRPRQAPPENESFRSAVYEKIPPNKRHSIDLAIVNHDPSTYHGIYEKFRLAEQGVNFWTFYRYARNIRSRAEVLHIAELVLPEDAHLGDALPKLIAQRLFQTLLYDEQASPQEIHRLTNAYCLAATMSLARDKFAASLVVAGQGVRSRQNDDFLKLVNNFVAAAGPSIKAHEARLQRSNGVEGRQPGADRAGPREAADKVSGGEC